MTAGVKPSCRASSTPISTCLRFAESLVTLNLEARNQVRSISDIQARIREVAKNQPPGTWIRGRGYHEFSLAGEEASDTLGS